MEGTETTSSGFVGEDFFADNHTLSGLQEIYSSPTGYNRLFRCERYGRLHVLKALQAAYAGSAMHKQALRKEFNIGYQLEHPHICRTLGWEQVPGLGQCILMEYIDGITLQTFMEQGKLTQPLAYKLIRELCSALQYLHSKQIVHRDLKPGNILVTHNGNNVKLIDFSLSDGDDYGILKLPAGTRYYLAPEVLQEGASLDLRADIYSLGVIIGEMATILNDKRLATVSRKCTQRKRERRYASAAEVAAALDGSSFRAYGWAAAMLLLLLAGTWAYRWGGWRQQNPEFVAFPVYGNVAEPDRSRRLLADERIRLHLLETADTLSTDSTRLRTALEELLHEEFPLQVQRHSEAYRKRLEELERSLSTIFSKRPQ